MDEDVARRRPFPMVLPALRCADGYELSVQASAGHYCSPREDWPEGGWSSVEVMIFEGEEPEGWAQYESGGVYSRVPLRAVRELIESHGGFAPDRELAAVVRAIGVGR